MHEQELVLLAVLGGGGRSPHWWSILLEVTQQIRDETRRLFSPPASYSKMTKGGKTEVCPSVSPHTVTNSPESGLAWVSDRHGFKF